MKCIWRVWRILTSSCWCQGFTWAAKSRCFTFKARIRDLYGPRDFAPDVCDLREVLSINHSYDISNAEISLWYIIPGLLSKLTILIISSRCFLFNKPFKRDSHLCPIMTFQHIAHKLCMHIQLYLQINPSFQIAIPSPMLHEWLHKEHSSTTSCRMDRLLVIQQSRPRGFRQISKKKTFRPQPMKWLLELCWDISWMQSNRKINTDFGDWVYFCYYVCCFSEVWTSSCICLREEIFY